jgi:hypothetical protein
MATRNGSGPADFAEVTSGEMHAWREALTCISRRLQDELDARMHRHGVPLCRSNAEDQSAFDWITTTCVDTFGASTAVLWTVANSPWGAMVRSVAGRGLADAAYRKPRMDAGLRRILETGTPVLRTDRGEGTDMIVPVVFGSRTIGLLRVASRTSGDDYTDEDLNTLRFMVEVAAACCHLALQERRVQLALAELEVLSLVAEGPEEMPRAA